MHTNGREPVSTGERQDDELARLMFAYQQLQQRDGNAEWREWRWMRISLIQTGVIVVLGAALAWAVLTAQTMQAFVQVVQRDEQGRMIQLGIPQHLLAYEPDEGVWRDMLGEWVTKRHWRGEETAMVRAQHDWAWLYHHTCGDARKQLQRAEEEEKPFKPNAKRTKIALKSITKTLTPDSYQVLWEESTTDTHKPGVERITYTTTFTVGRIAPATMTDATMNNLGLCVTGVDNRRHF